MYRFVGPIKSIFDNLTITIIIVVALFSLLIDVPNCKKKGFVKEYRMVKIISYSYIVFGVIIFIFLRMV
ncbi:CLC_0170 family protein [Schnuerera sp.]|uniref:CLC_0170 family protein n=1 Tax=Schnuerera sp. TaxID=2794844 RepID=UPI002CA26942|nr:CLC_0170 family protein [Schnuerera sp.]HSH35579.1 CLC_0170 family protein [Schnuerera sp.]